mmetsp:Transcript_71120/g.122217  ORF Transcript_71120/g.122217 Transcript_71120/m.122217 type:complete len:123 (-) Transcript_71120:388-756(-)
MWSVSTILLGFQSFMLENDPTLGSVDASTRQRRALAQRSLAFNCKDKVFCEVFPHLFEIYEEQKRQEVAQGGVSASSGGLQDDDQIDGRDGGGEAGKSPMESLCVSVAISVVLLAVLLKLLS